MRIGEPLKLDAWPNDDVGALTQEIAQRLRSVSELAGLPPEPPSADPRAKTFLAKWLIAEAAAWGHFTHELPIRIARSIAERRSTDADHPAMLTMTFGVGLVLVAYALQTAVVGILSGSVWLATLYLVSLFVGAYWAAFEKHPAHY